MEQSIWFMIFLQVFLIALNAVFASAEIAVISINDAKLAQLAAEGDKRALRLARLTSQPARFLATIQVAITLSGFLGSAFAAENFSDGLVSWLVSLGVGVPAATLDAIAVVIITLILSYFTLIFGELVPKRVAMRKAESLALGISGLISTIATLFAPIVWFLTVSTNAVLRLLAPGGRFAVILPTAEAERFLAVCAGRLALVRRTDVRTTPRRPAKRALMEFVRADRPAAPPADCSADRPAAPPADCSAAVPEVSELVVGTGEHECYTPEYRALTRDFYLKF